MSDIVRSLRAIYPTHPMVMEAADEIERLRKALAALVERGTDSPEHRAAEALLAEAYIK